MELTTMKLLFIQNYCEFVIKKINFTRVKHISNFYIKGKVKVVFI